MHKFSMVLNLMHTTSNWGGTAEAGLLKSWCEMESSVVPEWNGYPTCCMESNPPVLFYNGSIIKGVQQGDLQAGKTMLPAGFTALSKTQWGCVTYLKDCQSSLPRHADLWDFLQVILLLVPVVLLQLIIFGRSWDSKCSSGNAPRCQ